MSDSRDADPPRPARPAAPPFRGPGRGGAPARPDPTESSRTMSPAAPRPFIPPDPGETLVGPLRPPEAPEAPDLPELPQLPELPVAEEHDAGREGEVAPAEPVASSAFERTENDSVPESPVEATIHANVTPTAQEQPSPAPKSAENHAGDVVVPTQPTIAPSVPAPSPVSANEERIVMPMAGPLLGFGGIGDPAEVDASIDDAFSSLDASSRRTETPPVELRREAQQPAVEQPPVEQPAVDQSTAESERREAPPSDLPWLDTATDVSPPPAGAAPAAAPSYAMSERAARALEQTADRIRRGELAVTGVAADAADEAVLAAVLASLLGAQG